MRIFFVIGMAICLGLILSTAGLTQDSDQSSNTEASQADKDRGADSLITPRPIQDIRGEKKPLTNLDALKDDAEQKDKASLMKGNPIGDDRAQPDSVDLSNIKETAIQRGTADSLKPRQIYETRGVGDPILTNMKTYETDESGEVRFLLTKGVDLSEANFVLNFDLPLKPAKDLEQIYTFTPSSREQKHIALVEYLKSKPNLDQVAQLQLCISRREINTFTLRYYRHWSEEKTGQPIPETDPRLRELNQDIERESKCAEEKSKGLTELDVIQSMDKYRPEKNR